MIDVAAAMRGFPEASGMSVEHLGRGEVRLSLARRADLLQFNGYFHGGVVSGLADHAAGAAASSALPSGRIAVTVDLHVNFLRPAEGERLVAEGRCVQSGSTICVASVQLDAISGGQARRCAIATATLRVVALPGTDGAAARPAD